IYTIRKVVSPDLVVGKVIDVGIRHRLEQRLAEYDGNANKAFSNLDEQPIWMNEEKKIAIKRVAISGVSDVTPIHKKRDKEGRLMRNDAGEVIDVDFVSTGNNHHVAIYRDKDGVLQENIVSFLKATECARQGLSVVNRHYKEAKGWQFLFTMKINEYFVFPRYEKFVDEQGNVQQRMTFDPESIDLMNPANYALISPNLFRVQALSSKDYWFRHHLETTVDKNPKLKDITYKRLCAVQGAVKVRINHLGEIVHVGEY
ncbi:MAG: type II CRISPR RNA-guided endonuclease Cas9, partial [Alistipes sp.]